MIQRIQSVYLLLTTLLSGLFLTGNIFKLNSGVPAELIMNFRGLYEVTGQNNIELTGKVIPLTLVSALVLLISLPAIFLYRNRNLQLKVTLALIILEVLVIVATAYYAVHFIMHFDASLIPGFRMFIPLVTVVLSIFAYSGIRKDENLVRSYERLR
jgi:sterol desaturase/sphingolipid hydroxylase (fatty acid hydroxylase superfamily)